QLIHGLNESGLNFGANTFTLTQGLPIEEAQFPSSLALSDIGSWALGQFKTVAEVKAGLNQQLVYCTPLAILHSSTTPLHCAFYDETGASIVLEYFQGKQCIYDNPVGVMTNGPEFSWHLTNLNNYTHLSNIDFNQATFNSLEANQPDSGIATSIIPSSNTSVGRFIKAVYYSQFALKAKTPDEAVYLLSHVLNNFDRPLNITVDPPNPDEPLPEGKGDSEFTVWTALSDLTRRKFFVRSYLELNYQHFDLNELSILNSFKTIPYMSKYTGLASSNSQALIHA
ncbi:MAG: linear amide C-N hydrolase, partial [Snowella sp.]